MSADLILDEVTLFDGEHLLADRVSVAIKDGVFFEVSAYGLEHLVGPRTQRRNLQGMFMMPGLVDVHNHHAVAGKADLFELQIKVGASADEVIAAVAEHAAQLPENAWVTGGPWGTNLLGELNSLDMLAKLDKASGGRPVVLIEDSRHNRWVSTEAMRLAGITGDAPAEGVLLDAETGEPTGVLLEGAGLDVEKAMTAHGGITSEQHRAASARGIEVLNSFGITAFQDAAASLPILESLHSLDDDGELNAWVISSITMNDDIFGFDPIGQALIEVAERHRTQHHRPDFVKIFLDGVPPARTAAFLEPYLPDEHHGCDHRGQLLIQREDFLALVTSIAHQGLHVKVHCAGDAAVRTVLDATQQLREAGHTQTKVHIAHGQFISSDDLPRLAELDVTADMSPFVWFPGVIPNALSQVLPQPLAGRIQPNRELLERGTRLAMGSDWPVSPTPNPWVGIHGLVTRQDPFRQWPGSLWAEQATTLEEALKICTSWGAAAMGLGETVGRVLAGYSADFILTAMNPFELPADSLVDMLVTETWFAGRNVFTHDA